MKFKALIGTSILAMTVATPAFAQDAQTETDAFGGEIVVTAQRQAEAEYRGVSGLWRPRA